MRTRLTRMGDQLGIVLDAPLLEHLGIDAETELEISSDGSVIVVAPLQSPERDAKLKKVAGRVFDAYAGVFKKLGE